jgi:NADPH:quinone reductase-like Zn-dependent oxidoreductase
VELLGKGLTRVMRSGLDTITTCSSANFELAKSHGADAVFDYGAEDCISQIKQHTRNSLKYVIDCVSQPETMEFCYGCIGRSGGKLATLEPPPAYIHKRPKTVRVEWVLGPALSGKQIAWPAPLQRDADPSLREFAKVWFTTAQRLLDERKLKPHPLKLMSGGLDGVVEGLNMLREKQVSGHKLVFPLA